MNCATSRLIISRPVDSCRVFRTNTLSIFLLILRFLPNFMFLSYKFPGLCHLRWLFVILYNSIVVHCVRVSKCILVITVTTHHVKETALFKERLEPVD